MVVLNGNVAMFDVDDSIIMWQPLHPEAVDITIGKYTERAVIHHEHIAALKRHKFRGHIIVVWSQGESEWAEAVVKALCIEDYVDLCISEPSWYYDDLKAEEFMPDSIRVYNEKYKGRNVGHR